jgi:hypothetical protein
MFTLRASHPVNGYSVDMRELSHQLQIPWFDWYSVNTLSTRHSLANYLAANGDPGSAIGVLQALIPDLTRGLGANHPEVLDARWDPARYCGQNAERSQAVQQFREVFADRERAYGAGDQKSTPLVRNERTSSPSPAEEDLASVLNLTLVHLNTCSQLRQLSL